MINLWKSINNYYIIYINDPSNKYYQPPHYIMNPIHITNDPSFRWTIFRCITNIFIVLSQHIKYVNIFPSDSLQIFRFRYFLLFIVTYKIRIFIFYQRIILAIFHVKSTKLYEFQNRNNQITSSPLSCPIPIETNGMLPFLKNNQYQYQSTRHPPIHEEALYNIITTPDKLFISIFLIFIFPFNFPLTFLPKNCNELNKTPKPSTNPFLNVKLRCLI